MRSMKRRKSPAMNFGLLSEMMRGLASGVRLAGALKDELDVGLAPGSGGPNLGPIYMDLFLR